MLDGSDSLETSRRSWVHGAIGVGLLGHAPAPQPDSFSAVQEPSGERYFDIHIHLAQEWFGPDHGPISASDALRWMDTHGVAQAAVLPLVSPEAFWYPISTEFVLSETRPHRDR